MNKTVTALMCCCLIIASTFTSASGQTKNVKVGLSVWTGYPASVQGFKDALTEGGFIEGQNVEYLYGESGSDKTKQREIAQRFKDAQVDLVYSLTTTGTTIVKEIMPETTPVVFSIVTYPANSGLIESLENSGNNLVGTSNYVELTSYVTLLKRMLPETKSVAIFHRQKEANSKIQATDIIRLLKQAGIETIDQEPVSVEEVRQMASELAGKVDVFMTTTDTLMQGGGEQALIKISLDRKIPILSSNKTGIEQGATFGPVADFYTLGKMSGDMAIKILKKGMLPAQLQSKLQDPPLTLINRKSVDILGIHIPKGQLQNVQYVE